jgi:hypothetical protein
MVQPRLQTLLPTGLPYSLIRFAWNLIFSDYCGMSLVGLAKMTWRNCFCWANNLEAVAILFLVIGRSKLYKFLFAVDERSTDCSHTQRIHCIFTLLNNKLCSPKLGTTTYVQLNIICLKLYPRRTLIKFLIKYFCQSGLNLEQCTRTSYCYDNRKTCVVYDNTQS